MEAVLRYDGAPTAFRWRQLWGVCLLLLCGPALLRAAPVEHLFDLPGNFKSPSDVAVSATGRIYVVDGLNHCVKSFDPAGNYIAALGGKGSANAQFSNPLGLAIGAGDVDE